MSRIRTSAAVSLLTVVGIFTLSACAPDAAPSPVASESSLASACAAVQETTAAAADRLGQMDAADPAGALEALTAAATDIGGALDTARTTALEPALQRVHDGFTATSDALGKIGGGDLTQLAALQSAVSETQAAFDDIRRLCRS